MRRFKDWHDELVYRVLMPGDEDEKHQGGVYDMALDIAEQAYKIFNDNNTLNDIKDVYFPDTEIADAIYQAIKYGDHVS